MWLSFLVGQDKLKTNMKDTTVLIIIALVVFVGGMLLFNIAQSSTILTTSSTDTLNKLRTNVNTSLTNLNTDKVETGGDIGGSTTTPTVTDLTITSEATGTIIHFDGSNWVVLPAGTSGYVLTSSGANTAPSYQIISAAGSPTQIQFNSGGDLAGDSNLTWNSTTTTFTITGGLSAGISIFTGVVTGVTPTISAHLATKGYVDDVVNTEADFFLTDSLSDVSFHFDLSSKDTGNAENTITSSTISSGDDQFLFSYITTSTIPNSLEAGTYNGHFHMSETAASPTVQVYWTMSSFTSSSVETVRMMSETSSNLENTATALVLHASIGTDIELNSDDRLLFRIYANVTGGGSSNISLVQEGDTSSRFTIIAPSNVFGDNFVNKDGSTQLTGNWNMGGFNVGIGTSPDTTLDVEGDIRLSTLFGNQDYLFTSLLTGVGLSLSGTTANVDASLNMFSADGDGSDDVELILHGVGTYDAIANRERLIIGNNGIIDYQIYTEAGGSGTIRPLVLYTEGNANQLYLATSSNVGIGTSTPASKLEVIGDILAASGTFSGKLTSASFTLGSLTGFLRGDSGVVSVSENLVTSFVVGNRGSVDSATGTVTFTPDEELYYECFSLPFDSATTTKNGAYRKYFGKVFTIDEFGCDANTSNMTVQLDERSAPFTGGTDILNSAIACDPDGESTTTFSNAGIAANRWVNLDIDSMASSTALANVSFCGTWND